MNNYAQLIANENLSTMVASKPEYKQEDQDTLVSQKTIQ